MRGILNLDIARDTVTALVVEAIALNRSVGDPTAPGRTAR